jgi:hypothetical protein
MWALSTSPREVGLSLAHSEAFLRLSKLRRSADLSTNLRRFGLRLSAKLRRFATSSLLPLYYVLYSIFTKLSRHFGKFLKIISNYRKLVASGTECAQRWAFGPNWRNSCNVGEVEQFEGSSEQIVALCGRLASNSGTFPAVDTV